MFRRATGRPCPTCGGTRSVAHILGGDLAAAWSANPIIFLAVVVAAALLAVRLVVGVRPNFRIGPTERRLAWIVGGMLVLANWAWLLARGG